MWHYGAEVFTRSERVSGKWSIFASVRLGNEHGHIQIVLPTPGYLYLPASFVAQLRTKSRLIFVCTSETSGRSFNGSLLKNKNGLSSTPRATRGCREKPKLPGNRYHRTRTSWHCNCTRLSQTRVRKKELTPPESENAFLTQEFVSLPVISMIFWYEKSQDSPGRGYEG